MNFLRRIFSATSSREEAVAEASTQSGTVVKALARALRHATGVEAIEVHEIPVDEKTRPGAHPISLWINVGPLPLRLDDDARQIWEECRILSAKLLDWIGAGHGFANRLVVLSIGIGPGMQEGRALRGWVHVPATTGCTMREEPLRLQEVDSNVRSIRKLLEHHPSLRAPFPA